MALWDKPGVRINACINLPFQHNFILNSVASQLYLEKEGIFTNVF